MIELENNLFIDERWIEFSFARSGGPGGQNVNKVNTQVTVFVDLVGCGVFSDEQLGLIRTKLASRIDKYGKLRVTCSNSRSQHANRAAALERAGQLLSWSLRKEKPRTKTRVPKGVKERRLQSKKQRSQTKQMRSGRIEY